MLPWTKIDVTDNYSLYVIIFQIQVDSKIFLNISTQSRIVTHVGKDFMIVYLIVHTMYDYEWNQEW